MAISVMNWVWNHSRSRHGARLVLLAIADCAREDGTAWPSVTEIKRKTGLGDRAVQAAIIDCSKLGELDVGYQEGPKGCNRYRITMTQPPADIAGPPQILRGAETADPPQDVRGSEGSPQVNGQDPAVIALPADIAGPPQNSTPAPANFADGTVKEPKPKKKSVRDEPRPDVDRICSHLADRIVANGSKRPTITEDWRTSARLLLDRDRRREDQVHTAIDWCQDDDFWRSKVMSMPKLREKYDQLRLEAQRKRSAQSNGGRPSTTDQRVADILAHKSQPDEADPLPPNTIPGSVVQ